METISFAFSIMGVIASVSSTLSFGLVNGEYDMFGAQLFDKAAGNRGTCWNGFWLADTMLFRHVRRPVDG